MPLWNHAVEPADRFVLMFEVMLCHYRTPRLRTFNFLQFVILILKIIIIIIIMRRTCELSLSVWWW